jgi:hypothetical protein
MKSLFQLLPGIFIGLLASGVIWCFVTAFIFKPDMGDFGPFQSMVNYCMENKMLNFIGFLVCKIGEKVYQ